MSFMGPMKASRTLGLQGSSGSPFVCAYITGVRKQELLNVRGHQVDFERSDNTLW
jgi:hypothetical protein